MTRYEDVRRFFVDSRFSRSIASARGAVGAARAMSMTEMDPPSHTRIRRLAASAFSVPGVERLRPRTERIASMLADRLIAAGPPADLVEGFCAPLTFGAQCELLGVPETDRSAIRAQYATALSAYPGSTPEATHTAQLRLHACVRRVIED
ncbi:MAG: cytochrome P450, partial [Actinomycetota bacterium]